MLSHDHTIRKTLFGIAVMALVLLSSTETLGQAGPDPNAGPGPNGAPNNPPPPPAPSPLEFFGNWDLGEIPPGVTLKLEYTASNGCEKFEFQPVEFHYPFEDAKPGMPGYIPLDGPLDVSVKFGQPDLVNLEMGYPLPPPPPPGSPPPKPQVPVDPSNPNNCVSHWGILKVVHPYDYSWESLPNGDSLLHQCLPAEEHYLVTLCLLPYYSGPPGGGSKAKKPRQPARKLPLGLVSPDGSACSNLWYFGVFHPSPPINTPQDCAVYIRAEAHNLFDKLLAPYRAKDAAAWAWVPTGAAIDQLTVEQILIIKSLVFDALAKLAP